MVHFNTIFRLIGKNNRIFTMDLVERLTNNKSAKLAIHKARSIIDQ